jgi:hypothetical protein
MKYILHTHPIYIVLGYVVVDAVVQLFEALYCKLEGHGFDSQ